MELGSGVLLLARTADFQTRRLGVARPGRVFERRQRLYCLRDRPSVDRVRLKSRLYWLGK